MKDVRLRTGMRLNCMCIKSIYSYCNILKRTRGLLIPTAEMVIRDRKEECRGKRNREWNGVGRRAKQDGCGIVEVGSRMDIE